MTDVLIKRELLERLLYSNSPARFDATEYNAARAELFSILAQPAQQGEAVEVAQVVSYLSACADGYDPDAPIQDRQNH